tara:strand:- start:799 stop:1038 length:240 start_codon:yes stop_codon:yes gene_type:complete
MFLIEFKKDMYIDAERVNFINLTDGKVEFTLTGEDEFFTVDNNMERPFLNQLQALNQSLTNPEARHNLVNNPNTYIYNL